MLYQYLMYFDEVIKYNIGVSSIIYVTLHNIKQKKIHCCHIEKNMIFT